MYLYCLYFIIQVGGDRWVFMLANFGRPPVLFCCLSWTLDQARNCGDDGGVNMQYTCRTIQPLKCEADKNFFKNLNVINGLHSSSFISHPLYSHQKCGEHMHVIDYHWVTAITLPTHLRLINGPFVPHNLVSAQKSPAPSPKFQMAPPDLKEPSLQVPLMESPQREMPRS
jgi:hypothetical protein